MIWGGLWVAIAGFAFNGMFTGYMRPTSLTEYFFIGLFYCFMVAFAAMICGLMAYGTGAIFKNVAVEGSHHKLIAIRDKDGVEGAFFLGSGYINSQPYYFYYERLPDGAFRPGKIRADGSVKVYEEDRPDAELVRFDWETKARWVWLVAIPHDDEAVSYDFHVPKGTIKTGYSM